MAKHTRARNRNKAIEPNMRDNGRMVDSADSEEAEFERALELLETVTNAGEGGAAGGGGAWTET